MKLYEQGKKKNQNLHIKGKKQLIDLAESAKFMTSKYVELRERKEKEKLIKKLATSQKSQGKWKRVLMLSSNTLEEIV